MIELALLALHLRHAGTRLLRLLAPDLKRGTINEQGEGILFTVEHALWLPLIYSNFPTHLDDQTKEIKLSLKVLTPS
jgi:hypothetical protein